MSFPEMGRIWGGENLGGRERIKGSGLVIKSECLLGAAMKKSNRYLDTQQMGLEMYI